MKKCLLLIIVSLSCWLSSPAQFTDNFDDGDITDNPVWQGDISDWLVNSSNQLQSNNSVTGSTFYLRTANTLVTGAQWDFSVRLAFNPSGANYADVYLTASESNLTLSANTGYFVRIGNTDDEISLYRKDVSGSVKIIDGADGILNTSNNSLHIRVICTTTGEWILSRASGSGNFISEGLITDITYPASSYFGIVIKQSTASFFQRHFFDDISIQNYVPDVVPPSIISAVTVTSNTLDVLFNESIDQVSGEDPTNYNVSGGIGFPSLAVRDVSNSALVHLTFTNSFTERTNITLTINGVSDISGNAINNGSIIFAWFTSRAYDVVIEEIMADPSPVVGLPDYEWLELKNTSEFSINLQNWRIGSGADSGPMPYFVLKPDSFVVLTTGSALPELSPFGNVLTVTNFPALDNAGKILYLKSPQGNIIHAVEYSDSWYKNELKKEGGWTLEMIDTKNPCSGINNWTASENSYGASPCKKNSVDSINMDTIDPRLLRAYSSDSLHIILVFNEPLDSVSAVVPSKYTISDIGTPLNVQVQGPLFTKVELSVATPLARNRIYTVTVTGITDCAGNIISNWNKAKVGLAEPIDSCGIIINEILFNPRPGSVDYVELYNRSGNIINLKNAYIANRDQSGVISSITHVINNDYLLFPEEFIVLTTDVNTVLKEYVSEKPEAFIELNSMPSYSDDKGDVVLLDEQGKIVDEVSYLEKWHFKLISNDEGVALERIDYNSPTNEAENWHSAASSVNYGTPGYKNSQFRLSEESQAEVKTDPGIFSPDNDGFDDFLTIQYSFPQPGYMVNITLFDAGGMPVRYLERNALSGIKGSYRWDGLGEKNQRLPVGIYIIYTEIFNLEGKVKRFKNVVVLARRG